VIFVTVGTQLAFDRLVGAVDEWAGRNPDLSCFAQVGPCRQPPAHMPWSAFLSPSRTDQMFRSATLVVAHAGMGSVLTALRHGRPILILPRKAGLGEHRNDHQLATARWLAKRPGIAVAWEESEVAHWLDHRDRLATGPRLPDVASGPLVDRLAAFVTDPKP
jgi:UDP-N-acetylglucosamine transferase subunit ALG13